VTAEALAPADVPGRLLELNPDTRAAVLLDGSGALAASSDPDRGDALAEAARELWRAVDRATDEPPFELEAQVVRGSIFAIRNVGWTLAVVARRSALSSLMLYDLRAVLGELER
jgi:hypothetical protein